MEDDEAGKSLNQCQQFLSLYNEMEALFKFVPPERLRRNLECLLFSFLEDNKGHDVRDFKNLFRNMCHLFVFLETANDVLYKK